MADMHFQSAILLALVMVSATNADDSPDDQALKRSFTFALLTIWRRDHYRIIVLSQNWQGKYKHDQRR